jgi:hypothetical protein
LTEMPFESANPPVPPIRGPMRTALVRDLAFGTQNHSQLAEKYGRGVKLSTSFPPEIKRRSSVLGRR